MGKRVLFVDDEPDILNSFKRQLRNKFEIETALGGIEGLRIIDSNDTFAVIVSDYNMPGIDGIEFFKEVKNKSPNSVRVMLTGQASLNTAIDAVNEGHIFRFLTKPCPEEKLNKVLVAGIEFYQMKTAEKELLEKTLGGSIRLLTEILSLVNPVAFGRAERVKKYVDHIVSKLNLPFPWQFKLAAMLSMIGCVTIPPETLNKLDQDLELSEAEHKMLAEHPRVAKELLINIPRMGIVARMIEAQGNSYKGAKIIENYTEESLVTLGGNLIRIAIDYDRLLFQGQTHKNSLKRLVEKRDEYHLEAVEALRDIEVDNINEIRKVIQLSELRQNMILDENITNKAGLVIAVKGQEVTFTMIQRLIAFSKSIGISEPFKIIERRLSFK